MRIVIVDDERPARSELKYLVSLCEPDAQITEAASSEELLELMDRAVSYTHLTLPTN